MFVELFKRFGPNFRPQDVYAATLFGRLAALDAGVTTLLDWAHIQNSPSHADEAVRALREVGGRTVYAHGQPGIEPERWMKESTLPHPADIRRLREDRARRRRRAGHARDGRTRARIHHHRDGRARCAGSPAGLACGSPSTSVSAPTGPKYRGVERMHERRLLGPTSPSCIAAIAAITNSSLMAETGTTASVSAQIASAVRRFRPAGHGPVACARHAAEPQRRQRNVRKRRHVLGDARRTRRRAALSAERPAARPTPVSITARDVLGFATREGARAVGLEDKIGTITPGKSADLILIPRHALNLAPMGDPIGALVLGGHAGNVEAVLVEGRPLKWNGRMIGIDTRRAIDLLNLTRDYL